MSAAPNLDDLDAARGGPFTYRYGGQVHETPDPAALSFEAVLVILQTGLLPDVPDMPLYKRSALTRRWRAHYDLPEYVNANRLAFLLDRYRDDLDYDLRAYANVELGPAWRSRRWRTLLSVIDRLPPHSYFAEAVSKDPEHAKMLAEAAAAGTPSDSPKGPPLRTWTPEVALLTRIFDAVRHLEWTTAAVHAGKKAGDPPKASPTPYTLVDREAKRAEYHRKMEAHKALTKRLLPHKRD